MEVPKKKLKLELPHDPSVSPMSGNDGSYGETKISLL